MQLTTLIGDASTLAYGYLVAVLSVVAGLALGRAGVAAYLRAPAIALAVLAASLLLLAGVALVAGGALTTGALAIPVRAVLLGLLGVAAGRRASAGSDRSARHERGARIVPERLAERARLARRRAWPAPALTIAGFALTPADETRHCKLMGATGTGKTTAILELLGAALARGDRAVIADPDGGYARRYYRPERGDRILDAFDSRSARWDLFAELTHPVHADELARSLVPESEGTAREWAGYARTFLASTLRQLRGGPRATLDELYRLVVVADARELALLLAGTPAQPFLEAGNERMFGSLRSVAANALRGLDHARAQQGTPLAVREWVRDGQGALFLPYRADEIAAVRTLVAAWLRLAIFQTLSLPESPEPSGRRLWFVVDELDALGAIDGLSDALARLRKFGGCCVLGFQSIAQVSSVYGNGPAQTIVENCGNTLILRCSASEGGGTARFASRLIGEREVIAEQVTRSSGGSGRGRGSTSRTLQRRTEAAVLPAQIEQLPDRKGYLKLASAPDWFAVELAPPAP